MHLRNEDRGFGESRTPVVLLATLAAACAVLELVSVASGAVVFAAPTNAGPLSAVGPGAASPQASGAAQLAAAEQSLEASSASSGPLTTTSPSWTEAATVVPEARVGASMVYDAKEKYVLLFGGYGPIYPEGSVLADTWTYAGGVWTELSPATSPPARQLASMAYDAKDGYVVLYGGLGSSKALSDTWKFANGKWTKLSPTTNPGARYAASMAYDAKDGYVVLFGGTGASGLEPSLTWEFVGGQWTSISTTPAPGGRAYASMDYDAHDGYVLLFGGDNTSTGTVLGDTWSFSAGEWTELTPASAPPARDNSGLAYSAIDGEVVLFGGISATGAVLSDTWTFVGGAWTKISTAFHPTKRNEFAIADGTTTTDVLLFGGVSSTATFLNDNWTFHGLVWAHPVPRAPAARMNAAITYDEKDGYVLLFGGTDTATGVTLDDTWKFAKGVWTELHPSESPSPRFGAAMAYDPADGYVVLWGGQNTTVVFNDTWTFVGGQWSPLDVGQGDGSAPAPASRASMAYDAADGYLVLFGGTYCAYECIADDFVQYTWEFDAGVWTNVTPSSPSTANTPGPTSGAEMTYDSEDGYLLLVEGLQEFSETKITDYPATWSFSDGAWTNRSASLSAPPPPVNFGGLVDDTYDGYPVLWGGYDWPTGVPMDSTWEYTGSGWTELSPASSPPAADLFAMAFDPPSNEVVALLPTGATWTY
jgi:Galactose oxidase, central domain/Kelch motif